MLSRDTGEPTPEEMGIQTADMKRGVSVDREFGRNKPAAILLDIYSAREGRDISKVQNVLRESIGDLKQLESAADKEKLKKNVDWLLNNNNRINLYQITAVLNGEEYDRADEEMDTVKAQQLLAYRKIQAALLTAGEIEHPEGVQTLVDFITSNLENNYLCTTAIDSLAKSKSPEAQEKLAEIIDDEHYGFELRTRAVLAGLRAGMSIDSGKVSTLANEYVESLGDELCQRTGTYTVIEIAGLLQDHTASAALLDDLHTRMQKFPPEQNQWFERDIVSTRLAVRTDDRDEYLDEALHSRKYVAANGIVFGALDPTVDFEDHLSRHREKFEEIANLIDRLNQAFRTEPILYVDISAGGTNEAGWTQNSIYFSSDYLEHTDDVSDVLQTAGHEACERWQSKGFIDVSLSKYYVQLMGEQYSGSELDKFRLNHRLAGKSNAGHPWDGEREFIAELGSTLLVDPSVIQKLFDLETDRIALEAVEYLKTKLNTRVR